MAQLNFQIPNEQLIADVIVNLDAASLFQARANGTICPTIAGKGLIDTGSNATGISVAIVQRLGLTPVRSSSTLGVGGSHPVRLFHVSLHVFDSANPNLVWLSHPSLIVMELQPSFPYAVLIGMDVLFGCVLTLNGLARLFTLDF